MAGTLHLPGVVLRGAKNGARHENGAVNNNASSLHTIMPTQCSFLTTIGVALMGVRLQPGFLLKPPSLYDFPVRVNSNRDLFLPLFLFFSLFLSPIGSFNEKNTYVLMLVTSRFRNAKRPSSAKLSRPFYSSENSIDHEYPSVTRKEA